MLRWLPLLLAGCASSEYTRLYAVQDKPASWTWDEIGALERLGPTLVDRGVNFGVFAANATRMDLLNVLDMKYPELRASGFINPGMPRALRMALRLGHET